MENKVLIKFVGNTKLFPNSQELENLIGNTGNILEAEIFDGELANIRLKKGNNWYSWNLPTNNYEILNIETAHFIGNADCHIHSEELEKFIIEDGNNLKLIKSKKDWYYVKKDKYGKVYKWIFNRKELEFYITTSDGSAEYTATLKTDTVTLKADTVTLKTDKGEKENMEEENKKQKELISYYNKSNGKTFKYTDFNIEKINECVKIDDTVDVTNFKLFVNMNMKKFETLQECCEAYKQSKIQKEQEEKEKYGATINEAQASLGVLEKAMAKIFIDAKQDEIKEALSDKIFEQCKKKIEEEYGTIHRKTVLEIDEKQIDFGDEVLHEKFDTILKFVKQNEPVFLVGEAGTGKNYICKQVAKALGLNFYFSNAVTQEYKLTGFTDAMGNYQESQFYKAFKNGGLFMLDEMDASIPEVLVILNAAIANKYFDFPAPIGYVEAHPDFRVVSAGNTMGEGASYTYVGRSQLDGASLDRFAMVEVDYDRNIELRCANGDEELVNFVREIRRIAKLKKIQLIISYRCITRLAKMKNLLDLKEALKTCLFKSLNKNEIYTILDNFRGSSTYRNAIQDVYDELNKENEGV